MSSVELTEHQEALNAVYAERDMCIALAAYLVQQTAEGRAWLARHQPQKGDPWDSDWENVVFIELPTGQVSWHIHERELPWFDTLWRAEGAPARRPFPAWDGHTTQEKYDRLLAYLRGARH